MDAIDLEFLSDISEFGWTLAVKFYWQRCPRTYYPVQ
jgi:hypothetical protein